MVNFKFKLCVLGKDKNKIAADLQRCAEVITVAMEDTDFSEPMKNGFNIDFDVDGIVSNEELDKSIKEMADLFSKQRHSIQLL